MKLAVTGASGFIGRHFVDRFKSQYDFINVLSRAARWNNQRIREIAGDLGNVAALDELTQGIDVVLHAAFDPTYRQNISGVRQLLASCEKNDVKKLIHLSSYVVYDFSQSPITESSRFATRSDLYTREKIEIENIIRSHRTAKLQISIIQPTAVFGPGSAWSNAMFEAAKHRDIYLPNSGDNRCNAIYIDDLTELLHQSAIVTTNSTLETRIASNILTTWREFLQFHAELLKKKAKPVHQFHIGATTQRLFSDSLPMNLLMRYSGLFPFNILVQQRLKGKLKGKPSPSSPSVMDAPLSDTPFRSSGTARLCQSWSHEVVSDRGSEKKPLIDWFNPFCSQL